VQIFFVSLAFIVSLYFETTAIITVGGEFGLLLFPFHVAILAMLLCWFTTVGDSRVFLNVVLVYSLLVLTAGIIGDQILVWASTANIP
jgi:hypothetical protein